MRSGEPAPKRDLLTRPAPATDRNDRSPFPSAPAASEPPFEVENLGRGGQSGPQQRLRRQQRDVMAGRVKSHTLARVAVGRGWATVNAHGSGAELRAVSQVLLHARIICNHFLNSLKSSAQIAAL